jgi:hypothetical protein
MFRIFLDDHIAEPWHKTRSQFKTTAKKCGLLYLFLFYGSNLMFLILEDHVTEPRHKAMGQFKTTAKSVGFFLAQSQ